MTPQERMKELLTQLELPRRQINVYGSQITVECWCEEAGKQWAKVLRRFATVRATIPVIVPARETEHLPNMRQMLRIWRVYARV